MTWDIVVGIIALVTACASIGKIIANNTKAMTEVKCSIDDLKASSERRDNTLAQLSKTVNGHETRICILERKDEK